MNRHEFTGDVTVYIHHGVEVDGGKDYYVKLKDNPATSLDSLSQALNGLTVKIGSFKHVACFINKETRAKQGVRLLKPHGRMVKKLTLGKNYEEVWQDVEEYYDLIVDDCHVSWGSTRVEVTTVKNEGEL